jgi:hypothetical protein
MASSLEKVIAFHVSRLKDKRPDVRLKSIAELQALGADAEAALAALEECFKESEEEEVKKAAQQAGFDIFMAVKKSKKE